MNWTALMNDPELLRQIIVALLSLLGIITIIEQRKTKRLDAQIDHQKLEIEKVRAEIKSRESEDNQQERLLTAILTMAQRMEGITNALIARTEATDKERMEWRATIEEANRYNAKIAESLVNMSTAAGLQAEHIQEQIGQSRQLAASINAGIADVHTALDESAAATQTRLDANTAALESLRAEVGTLKAAVENHAQDRTVLDVAARIETKVEALLAASKPVDPPADPPPPSLGIAPASGDAAGTTQANLQPPAPDEPTLKDIA